MWMDHNARIMIPSIGSTHSQLSVAPIQDATVMMLIIYKVFFRLFEECASFVTSRVSRGLSFQDRYAYRENMSDVIVQHLISEQKVRLAVWMDRNVDRTGHGTVGTKSIALCAAGNTERNKRFIFKNLVPN